MVEYGRSGRYGAGVFDLTPIPSSSPLLELGSDLRITYEIGNEHSPVDLFGRSILVLEGNGSARVVLHRSGGSGVRAWEGRVTAPALVELLIALREAGFPETPTKMFVPDAPIARLRVEREAEHVTMLIDRYDAAKLAGYREAYAILDGLAWQLSGGATALLRGESDIPRAGAITDAKPVTT